MHQQCVKMTIRPGEWVCEHGGIMREENGDKRCERVIPQSFECRRGFDPDGPAGYQCVSEKVVPAIITCPPGFHIDQTLSNLGHSKAAQVDPDFQFVQGFAGMECVQFIPAELEYMCSENEIREGEHCISILKTPCKKQCPVGTERQYGNHGELECIPIKVKKEHDHHTKELKDSSHQHKYTEPSYNGKSHKEPHHPQKHVDHGSKSKGASQDHHGSYTKEASHHWTYEQPSHHLTDMGDPHHHGTYEEAYDDPYYTTYNDGTEHIQIHESIVRRGLGRKKGSKKGVRPEEVFCKEKIVRQAKRVCTVVDHPTMGCVRIATAVPDKRCPVVEPPTHGHGHGHHPHGEHLHNGMIPLTSSISSTTSMDWSGGAEYHQFVPVDEFHTVNPAQQYVPAGGSVADYMGHHGNYVPAAAYRRLEVGEDGDAATEVARELGSDPFQWSEYFGGYRGLGGDEEIRAENHEDSVGGEGTEEVEQVKEIEVEGEETEDGEEEEKKEHLSGSWLFNTVALDPPNTRRLQRSHPQSQGMIMGGGTVMSSSTDISMGGADDHHHRRHVGDDECVLETTEDATPTCPSDMEPLGPSGVGGKCLKVFDPIYVCPPGWNRLTDNSGCGLELMIDPSLMMEPTHPPPQAKKKGKHGGHH
eukprot:GHVN01055309.1.p1 GENE.GHVN01055309.1~~GHVN01055309.1.p1  ORF type:complete len:750 (+),score=107.46 GHVN01055309.1:323-2251(+)